MKSLYQCEIPDLHAMPDIVAYIKTLEKPSMADSLAKADAERRVLVQPRSGVACQQGMIEVLQTIDALGKADLLTLTIDSYTRLKRFDAAERLLKHSPEQLNGYPLVAHGFRAVRSLNEQFDKPLQVRHGSPDGRRLFAESIAGGIQSYEGGGIGYNLPYCKDVPLEKSLRDWHEIDRACGEYEAMGVTIDREFFGTLSAVLVPPSIALAVVFLEAILAAREGCKCLSLAYPQTGNIVQDVAALKTIRTLARLYLPDDASVYPVLHQFMGVFPKDIEKAEALIFYGGLTARIGGATKTISKTTQEAIGIPDSNINAAGVRRTRSSFQNHLTALSVDAEKVKEEAYWIERETRELIDPVLSEPDLIPAIVSAFHDGRLDIPFPANNEAKGCILPIRDADIAIRYAEMGNLPFSPQVKTRNESKVRPLKITGKIHQAVLDSIMYFTE